MEEQITHHIHRYLVRILFFKQSSIKPKKREFKASMVMHASFDVMNDCGENRKEIVWYKIFTVGKTVFPKITLKIKPSWGWNYFYHRVQLAV